MTTSEALSFLQAHQPMPDDDVLDAHPEILQKYEEVRKYFVENPDPRCIELFLNSFGGWNGFGVYQLVEDVFLIRMNISLENVYLIIY